MISLTSKLAELARGVSVSVIVVCARFDPLTKDEAGIISEESGNSNQRPRRPAGSNLGHVISRGNAVAVVVDSGSSPGTVRRRRRRLQRRHSKLTGGPGLLH